MKYFKTLFFIFFSSIASIGRSEWKFSGHTGPYFNALNVPSTTVTQSQRSGLIMDFKLDYKSESPWRFKSDITFRTDFLSRDASEFFQILPKNFYLQRKRKSLLFKVGIQTLSIDGPDIINPSDVVNPKNWVDPTNPLQMGSPGISLSQEIKGWNWELLYIPYQFGPTLPGVHNAWLPRENKLPIESNATTIQIPENVKYQYLHPSKVNHPLENNIAINLKNKSEKLETQFLYYNGLSQSPFLLTKLQGSLISVSPEIILVDSPVQLKPLYYRHQAIAGSFLIPFESWAIRGGFNWLKPEGHDQKLPGETTLSVIGGEKSIDTSFGVITGIFDYIRQKRQDENQISFLRSMFEEALAAGVRIPMGEETTFLFGGIYDLRGHSSIIKSTLTRRLTNSWSVEGQAQMLNGNQDTMIGIYRNHDSIQLKLQYSW